MDKALVHNTDLRVAEANLAEARAALEEVRANRLPATAFGASASYGRSSNGGGLTVPSYGSVSGGTSGAGGGGSGSTSGTGTGGTTASGGGTGTGGTTSSGGGTTTTNGFSSTGHSQWTYNAAFDAAYEVDLFGRIRRAIQAARADTQAYAEARDLVRVDTAAETARAYAQACTYALQSDVQRRSLTIVSGQYDAVVTPARAGLGLRLRGRQRPHLGGADPRAHPRLRGAAPRRPLRPGRAHRRSARARGPGRRRLPQAAAADRPPSPWATARA